VGSEALSPWAVTTENQRVANDYDEDHPMSEFIVEIALSAALCLSGGVFIFLWGKHPALMFAGIAMFAVVGGWLGYSFRKGVDPQSFDESTNSDGRSGRSAGRSRRLRGLHGLLLV
jgi:hypothetical protein